MPVLSLLVFNLSLHWVPIVLYAFAVDFAVEYTYMYAAIGVSGDKFLRLKV